MRLIWKMKFNWNHKSPHALDLQALSEALVPWYWKEEGHKIVLLSKTMWMRHLQQLQGQACKKLIWLTAFNLDASKSVVSETSSSEKAVCNNLLLIFHSASRLSHLHSQSAAAFSLPGMWAALIQMLLDTRTRVPVWLITRQKMISAHVVNTSNSCCVVSQQSHLFVL